MKSRNAGTSVSPNLQYTDMTIFGIAQSKHCILLEASKDLDENLMLNGSYLLIYLM